RGLDSNSLGLAWIDLATGDFFTVDVKPNQLATQLARTDPREILICTGDELVQVCLKDVYSERSSGAGYVPAITRESRELFDTWISPDVCDSLGRAAVTASSLEFLDKCDVHNSLFTDHHALTTLEYCQMLIDAAELTKLEYNACRALLNYILKTQIGLLPPVQPPVRYDVDSTVKMSNSTIQNLELVRPIFSSRLDYTIVSGSSSSFEPGGGSSGQRRSANTVLAQINRTRTHAGSRLLVEQLLSPSTSADIINSRLDLVEFFVAHPFTKGMVHQTLVLIRDAQRAVHKLSLNCGGPADMLSIASTLVGVAKIKKAISRAIIAEGGGGSEGMDPGRELGDCLREAAQKERSLHPLDSLAEKIQAMIIDPNEPPTSKESTMPDGETSDSRDVGE
ncbi:MutS protein 1, partial [Spiromyces aspiralis]